jgi:hypothetical protein
MPADVHVGSFKRVNEVERDLSTGLVEVILEGLIDVAVGLLTRDDRLADHRRAPDASPA